MSRTQWTRALFAILLFAAAACRQDTRTAPTMVDFTGDSAPEAQLASLQVSARRVPRPLVLEFDQVLTALEVRCTESRTGSPNLVNVAVHAVAAAKKTGHDLTPLEALRNLESSIHEGADMKIDCADASKRLLQQLGR